MLIRYLSACILALWALAPLACGAQGTAARAPTSFEELQRRTAELLDQTAGRSKAFEETLNRTLAEIQDRKQAIENAEKIVDEMLQVLRRSIEEGRPDGRLAQEIGIMMRISTELAMGSENENQKEFAEQFRERATGFSNLRTQLEGAYAEGLRAMREVEARKRTIVRAKQLQQFDLAYKALETALIEYKAVTEGAQKVADAASSAASPSRPRQ